MPDDQGASAHPARPPARPKYTPTFERFWKLYPPRPGNSKREAFQQWERRLKEGADPQEILEGTRRYAAYCQREGVTGSSLVKLARTFLGPGWHWESDWGGPAGQKQQYRSKSGRQDKPQGGAPGQGGDLLRYYEGEKIV